MSDEFVPGATNTGLACVQCSYFVDPVTLEPTDRIPSDWIDSVLKVCKLGVCGPCASRLDCSP